MKTEQWKEHLREVKEQFDSSNELWILVQYLNRSHPEVGFDIDEGCVSICSPNPTQLKEDILNSLPSTSFFEELKEYGGEIGGEEEETIFQMLKYGSWMIAISSEN